MIAVGVICIGYWGVQLVVALIPPPANPYKEYTADALLDEYEKNKIEADDRFAEKVVVVRGKVKVIPDLKRNNPVPLRILFETANGKEDLASNASFMIRTFIGKSKTVRSTGSLEKCNVSNPVAGVMLLEANLMIDPKKVKVQAEPVHRSYASAELSPILAIKLHHLHTSNEYNHPIVRPAQRCEFPLRVATCKLVLPPVFVQKRNSHG